jgi:endonuclease/exonuclease/phosphatase family metal-dependent hydrolase
MNLNESRSAAIGSPNSFTVLTYNVGNGLAEASRLASFVRDSGADIIGLQEIDAHQAAVLNDAAAEVYPYRILLGSGFSGRGLLSKFPILDEEWHEWSPGRPDLRVVLDVAGRPTTVVVAHPPPPRIGRQGIVFDPGTVAQIDRLAEITVAAPSARLLGDFNMTSRHPSYAQLTLAGLVDAYLTAGAGYGSTFPLRPGRMRRFNHRMSWVPLPSFARVDFIWHTVDLSAVAAWVKRGAGSDHRPVFARLVCLEDDLHS